MSSTVTIINTLQDDRLAAGQSVVRLPCCLKREVVSEDSSHSKDEEETKPLMAADIHSCSGHGSINHGSSFVDSTEGPGVDANHILLISHTHSHDS